MKKNQTKKVSEVCKLIKFYFKMEVQMIKTIKKNPNFCKW